MKYLILILLLSSCAHLNRPQGDINILHYNIKELDSKKIKAVGPQLKAVKEIIKDHKPNVYSINEIQYDLPSSPSKEFKTKGTNLSSFLKIIDDSWDEKTWNQSFHQANTGNHARKKKNGNYFSNFKSKSSRHYADPVNFGIFPGQYSTGLSYKFPKKSEVVITGLKWRSFNRNIKPHHYTKANGSPLPKNMELFDKDFTDVTIDVKGKSVHLIALHTVPSFHFGNKKSPNYVRNRDQLRFLEWYTTGSTDIKVTIKDITPLPKGSLWIAIGDWNTDVLSGKNPGSKVLKRFFAKTNSVFKNTIKTHEADGFSRKRWSATLDYIAYSDGLKLVDQKILTAEEGRLFLGCDKNIPHKLTPELPAHRHIVKYFDKVKKKNCFVSVNKKFFVQKQASDHFPLWASFKI